MTKIRVKKGNVEIELEMPGDKYVSACIEAAKELTACVKELSEEL